MKTLRIELLREHTIYLPESYEIVSLCSYFGKICLWIDFKSSCGFKNLKPVTFITTDSERNDIECIGKSFIYNKTYFTYIQR